MLYFLDAQYNVKGAPNENFAREVMELFTMGVGNYSERDVRECARAFTGWYFDDLSFKVDPAKHDDGPKTFLGRTGNFDGVEVVKIIFEQPVTAEYLAGKIYRFLVRDELSEPLRKKLAAVLRDNDYQVKPLLMAIFTSKDFYSQASYGAHIKGPVEHLVAMMKQLGVDTLPGVPDFNQATIAMGQHLLNPPSVAGWAGGKSWITPGLLIERGNIASDVLVPDMTGFRDWNFSAGTDDLLGRRLREGYDIGAATAVSDPANMSMFDRVALERDEQFNTRISGYIGWVQAARKLIPTPRRAAQVDLTHVIADSGAKTAGDAVDYLLWRLLRVPAAKETRDVFVAFLTQELGTDDIDTGAHLHGRRAAHDGPPDHEHARIPDGLTRRRRRIAGGRAAEANWCAMPTDSKRPPRLLARSLAIALLAAATASAAPPQEAQPYEPQLNQPGKNVQWVPTPGPLVEKMLDMAKLTPKDRLVDLGSGDGVLVIAAARRGIRARGIEYDRRLVDYSKRRRRKKGSAR